MCIKLRLLLQCNKMKNELCNWKNWLSVFLSSFNWFYGLCNFSFRDVIWLFLFLEYVSINHFDNGQWTNLVIFIYGLPWAMKTQTMIHFNNFNVVIDITETKKGGWSISNRKKILFIQGIFSKLLDITYACATLFTTIKTILFIARVCSNSCECFLRQ